jgi:hypothetical protein
LIQLQLQLQLLNLQNDSKFNLTLNLKLKLKLNPKSDHMNVVKTTCFGLGNGFVTFLDNKRDVKGTYSAF